MQGSSVMGMATRRARQRPKSGDPEATVTRSYRECVGQRLFMLRARLRLSSTEAAGEIGCSQSVISKWERGESLPAAEWLVSIASVYGVSIDWLLRQPGDNEVVLIDGDQVAKVCKAAAGKPQHDLWQEPFALGLGDNILPLHGAATVQLFKDCMRRVQERGRPDDVRDALAWVAVLDR